MSIFVFTQSKSLLLYKQLRLPVYVYLIIMLQYCIAYAVLSTLFVFIFLIITNQSDCLMLLSGHEKDQTLTNFRLVTLIAGTEH